jgi:hypothetical protein
MKKSRLTILVVLVFLCLIGIVYAAVDISSEGTRVGATEHINFVGPTVSESGGVTTVSSAALTKAITIAEDLYVTKGVTVDGGIYMTGKNGLSNFYMKNAAGKCSMCTLSSSSTAMACSANAYCPPGF